MSKKISASKLSEMLNIPEHPPIVGGTLSRDWLYSLWIAVGENIYDRNGWPLRI